MGVKASVATIFVNFDQSSVEAGYPVSGKAYLSVNQAEVDCVSIGCRVLGQESTQVTYTVTVGSGDNQRTETRTAYERRNFLNLNFILQQIPQGRIQKGQYEYPFTFTVPASAPASMSASGGSGDHCRVAYSMEVWLDRPGLLRWDIRNTRSVTVVRPVPVNSKSPLYIEPCRIDLYSCCCFKRGNVLLGGVAESSMLYAGANTSVKYAAQNNSTVRIKAIEVSLLETIHFHAQGHHAHSARYLYKRRMSPEEARLDLQKLDQQHGAGYDPMNDLRRLSEMLASDQTKLDFSVSSEARSSYNGSLIRVHHVLSMQLMTTFGTANPAIMREIQMFNKAPAQEFNASVRDSAQLPSLPADWAPSVAPQVVLPTLQVSKNTVADTDDDDIQPVNYSSGAAPGEAHRGDAKFTSCAQLLDAISHTYDPCCELERYLRQGNRADELEPEDFYRLFKAVNDVFDQQRFADILAADMTCTTCVKVARATAGAKEMCKREVAEKLLNAGQIMDKEENAHLVKSELSAFQYFTVEKYFR